MLDSCQYDPANLTGGMIQSGTYRWMEPILYEAWENDTEVITVTHHNLLEQSGVSDAFYDDCTIEHNEELLQMLSDNEVRLHLSGHLHLQHYMEEDGVTEVVTRDRCYLVHVVGDLHDSLLGEAQVEVLVPELQRDGDGERSSEQEQRWIQKR